MDVHSEELLKDLHPKLGEVARKITEEMQTETGHEVRVISGYRSWEEQTKLWQQGRDAQGRTIDASKIVTNAKGGFSMHNLTLAMDMVPSKVADGEWDPDWDGKDAFYAKMIEIGEREGLRSGSNWHSIVDYPHFQLYNVPNNPTLQMRNDFVNLSRDAFWTKVDSNTYAAIDATKPGA